MPTCVAARPAPPASCISSAILSTSRREIVVEVLDVVRFQAQHRIRVLPDLRERETASRDGFRIGLALDVVADVLGVRVDNLLVALVGHGASVLTASRANPCQKPCGSTSTTAVIPAARIAGAAAASSCPRRAATSRGVSVFAISWAR